jgi:hypothetical protein
MSDPKFTLRVDFLGACAFVPDRPLFLRTEHAVEIGKPTEVDVLLPDLLAPRLASWETDANARDLHIRASHWPVLVFDVSSVVSTDLRTTIVFTDPESGRLRHAHRLFQEAVEFNELSAPLGFESSVPNPLTLECPPESSSALRRSLWWLPQMAEISPEHALARKELLAGVVSDGVAGRLTLRGGQLSVVGFNENDDCTWDFHTVARPQGGDVGTTSGQATWGRAIGNRIRLEGEIAASFLTVSIANPQTTHTLVLAPDVPGGTLSLTVANIEPEALFAGVEPLTTPPTARADADFEAHYTLSVAPVAADRLRVPVKTEGPAGSKEKPCAPTLFAGRG